MYHNAISAGQMQGTSSLFVRSLEKGLRVLEAFQYAEGSLGLGDVVRLTGLEKSAAQRCVHTLVATGYLVKNSHSSRLTLGTRVLDLGFFLLQNHPLVIAATPILLQLRRDCGERTNLSLFDGETLIYAIRLQGRNEYPQYSTLVGRRMPSYCAAGGRAALSRLPDDEVRSILGRSALRKLTPKTLTDPNQILEKIAEARQLGYSVAVEESSPNEVVVAAPVLDVSGMPIASVHIAGSLNKWSVKDFEGEFAPRVLETAAVLGRSDGHRQEEVVK